MLRHHKQWHWLGVSLLVIILDQASKFLLLKYLNLKDSYYLLPFLNLRLVHNSGAAFSFLGEAGGWQRWLFVVIAIAACLMIIVWLWRLSSQQRWQSLALALILGGAIGNLVDRITLGYVNDFIDFHIGGWHFATFNIADSAITIGVILLIVILLFYHREKSS